MLKSFSPIGLRDMVLYYGCIVYASKHRELCKCTYVLHSLLHMDTGHTMNCAFRENAICFRLQEQVHTGYLYMTSKEQNAWPACACVSMCECACVFSIVAHSMGFMDLSV